ncbi:N-acetylneuraminate synthase [Bradyrhizobium tropiciagri]|uniref:N-acetylneuraminate synthase n=1 Tax=Bradyrhizobium tropiciagri TaxID=312253 RepID=UPI001BA48527|nr:N-acetylneuraminate synthase [Bradyrhizobium tropiciagri]MBR0875143.1 N-acetylneuraminate synthase [Bradyrhizobium tropiciagri]
MQRRTLIIAEAGVNHNGDPARALALVEAAARAGADVVKFQSFRADKLATSAAAKASYQQATTGNQQSQLEMLRALELSGDDEERIAAACAAAGITYMSTPFDADSATHLVRRIGVSTLKVGSGDLTNAPLLLHLARFKLPIILSTGMATLAEVEQALGVIAFGYLGDAGANPTPADLARILLDRPAWGELRAKVTLLHCTTEYPADPQSINLRAMATLRDAFGLAVGFSDHSRGIHIAAAAVALGATVIEKHMTLDRNLPGPDHRASIEPDEMAAMIASIRDIELALGDGRKVPAPEEVPNRSVARRSLVAIRPIRSGERFTEDNLGVKRPGDGVSPIEYWNYLGRTAPRDYAANEALEP